MAKHGCLLGNGDLIDEVRCKGAQGKVSGFRVKGSEVNNDTPFSTAQFM